MTHAERQSHLMWLIETLTNTCPQTTTLSTEQLLLRTWGLDRPEDDPAITAVGVLRLVNIWALAERIFHKGIPGDFMECGVWRGGASAFMRACQKAYREDGRKTWLVDTFAGCPPPSHPRDEGDDHHLFDFLRIPMGVVAANLEKLGLDDVVFIQKDVHQLDFPWHPAKLALLRLDMDTYGATKVALERLYPLVSPGGFVISDDYYNLSRPREAVDEFLDDWYGPPPSLTRIDACGAYWRKP